MAVLRIRIKLGDREFEIEGAAEAVEKQFHALKPFFAALAPESLNERTKTDSSPTKTEAPIAFQRIARVRGRIYSLSAPAKLNDAVLALLLLQRVYRRNENVSGLEIMEGLRDSGFRVYRVDALLKRFAQAGLVISTGQRRSRRYRLSAEGVAAAEKIAGDLIAKLPMPQEPAS